MALVLVDSWEQCQLAKSLAVNDDCLVTSWSLSSVTSHQHHHPRLTGRYSRTTQVLDFNAARDAASGRGASRNSKTCKAPSCTAIRKPTLTLVTDQIPFLPPNQHCQYTEGKANNTTDRKILYTQMTKFLPPKWQFWGTKANICPFPYTQLKFISVMNFVSYLWYI